MVTLFIMQAIFDKQAGIEGVKADEFIEDAYNEYIARIFSKELYGMPPVPKITHPPPPSQAGYELNVNASPSAGGSQSGYGDDEHEEVFGSDEEEQVRSLLAIQ